MFDHDTSDRLNIMIKKLVQKDKRKSEILKKKMAEIILCDDISINRYKNCRYDLKEYKRVHIDRHFVLLFKVDITKNFILFEDFGHHDDIFGK